jgi:hypothetical protein
MRSLPQQSVVEDPTEPQTAAAVTSSEEPKPDAEPVPSSSQATSAASGEGAQKQQQQQQQQRPEEAAAAGEPRGTGSLMPAQGAGGTGGDALSLPVQAAEGSGGTGSSLPAQGTGGSNGTGSLLPAQALDAYPGALDGAAARRAAATAGDAVATEGEGTLIAQHAHTQSELLIQTDADGAVTAAAAISQTMVGNVTTGAKFIAFERKNDTAKLGVVRLLPAQLQLPYPVLRNASEAELRNVSSLLRDRTAAKMANRTGHGARKAAGKEEGLGGRGGKGQQAGGSGGCGKNRNAPCKFFLLVGDMRASEGECPNCCFLGWDLPPRVCSARIGFPSFLICCHAWLWHGQSFSSSQC